MVAKPSLSIPNVENDTDEALKNMSMNNTPLLSTVDKNYLRRSLNNSADVCVWRTLGAGIGVRTANLK